MGRILPCSLQAFSLTFVFFLLGSSVVPTIVVAANLRLRWVDTSTNEDGFLIERKASIKGKFTQIAVVGANVSFYADTGLVEGVTYCYRVRAYNAAGASAYSNEACKASTFFSHPKDKIGVFRPSAGQWHLDINGNGVLDDCPPDGCAPSFSQPGRLPVVGDWTGGGSTLLGVFDPHTRVWQLDGNGNDTWEGCTIDLCFGPLWQRGGLPVAGRWGRGFTRDVVGLFLPKLGIWRLDRNGNGKSDLCRIDSCFFFGRFRGLPVVGDWTGTDTTKIGIFNPNTGLWTLDRNGNGRFDGCTVDACFGPFGSTSDLPVAGDWSGTGQTNIGVYDPTTGVWELDVNGNGLFENCKIDWCLGPFGQVDDVPIVGRW
jgi:hypothetical protein